MGVQCGIAAASVVELFRVSQIGNVQQEAVCSFDSTVPLSVSCVEVALYRGSRVLVPVPSCNKFVTVYLAAAELNIADLLLLRVISLNVVGGVHVVGWNGSELYIPAF